MSWNRHRRSRSRVVALIIKASRSECTAQDPLWRDWVHHDPAVTVPLSRPDRSRPRQIGPIGQISPIVGSVRSVGSVRDPALAALNLPPSSTTPPAGIAVKIGCNPPIRKGPDPGPRENCFRNRAHTSYGQNRGPCGRSFVPDISPKSNLAALHPGPRRNRTEPG